MTSAAFSPNHAETLGRTITIVAGTLFSPSVLLIRPVLSAYLDLDRLLSHGMNVSVFVELVMRLDALGPQVLFCRIMPLLLLCMLISLVYLALCARYGGKLARILFECLSSKPVAG